MCRVCECKPATLNSLLSWPCLEPRHQHWLQGCADITGGTHARHRCLLSFLICRSVVYKTKIGAHVLVEIFPSSSVLNHSSWTNGSKLSSTSESAIMQDLLNGSHSPRLTARRLGKVPFKFLWAVVRAVVSDGESCTMAHEAP